MQHINKENIEQYFFDFVEGNLSKSQQKELEQFVLENPEFKPDFDAWKASVLPDEKIVAPDFSDLIKKPWYANWLNFGMILGGTILIGTTLFLLLSEESKNDISKKLLIKKGQPNSTIDQSSTENEKKINEEEQITPQVSVMPKKSSKLQKKDNKGITNQVTKTNVEGINKDSVAVASKSERVLKKIEKETSSDSSNMNTKEIQDLSRIEENLIEPIAPENLNLFIKENFEYPEAAIEKGIEGIVQIEFLVNTDGSVCCVEVIDSISSECDSEAKRIVEMLPDFTPAYKNDEPISYIMQLSFPFELTPKQRKKARKGNYRN